MPMQSRTDQVHSYEFFLQRVVSGLVARESDPAELPFRRLGWAGFGSVMVTVLVAAVFGVIGVLVGGGATDWRDGGSIVIEKGSETPYIYRDGRLHPMVNVVSAQLALGSTDVSRVSARSIEGVPRGPTLGIPGAPQGLPAADRLTTADWALCSQQRADDRGGTETVSVLAVGGGPDGGGQIDDRAVLVREDGGAGLHMLWEGYRFALEDEVEATLGALGVGRGQALPVPPAWLDALPVGDPLRPPVVTGERGRPTTAFGGPDTGPDVLTGQVIEDAGRFFLVTASELVEMTPLQAGIVIRSPATREAYPDGTLQMVRTPVPANVRVARLPGRTETSPPADRPEFATEDLPGSTLCAEFPPGQFAPRLRSGTELPVDDAIETPAVTAQGGLLADYVLVEGGTAALVQAVSSPNATGGSWHVVTDQGVRYPLPGPEVAEVFGYQRDRGVQVRATLLALLPVGPALDPAQATEPVDSVTPDGEQDLAGRRLERGTTGGGD